MTQLRKIIRGFCFFLWEVQTTHPTVWLKNMMKNDLERTETEEWLKRTDEICKKVEERDWSWRRGNRVFWIGEDGKLKNYEEIRL